MEALRDIIDQVRTRTDLVALIGRDTALRQAGSVYKGLSPFRQERDPSLVVWPQSQTWRDFSGGLAHGGDCLDYLMARDGLGFWEALSGLASKAGIALPGQDSTDLAQVAERRRIEGLLTEAARYYHQRLPPSLRDTWLRQRYGFTDATIDQFLLGFATGDLYQHLVDGMAVSQDEALATGLFVRLGDGRVVDFFQQRLVFPYWRQGRVVYFIARRTERTPQNPWEEAKYKKLLLRSDKHPYISPVLQNDTFYNEDALLGWSAKRKLPRLLITEGVTDCISAIQASIPCISPVTVRFRKRDLPKLVAMTAAVEELILCNDNEASGIGEAAALETAQCLHAAGRVVRLATIPRPKEASKIDLNALVSTGGATALHHVLDAAPDWIEHQILAIPADSNPHALSAQLQALAPAIQQAAPVLRDAYAKHIKRRFKLRAATLRQLLPIERAAVARQDLPGAKGQVFDLGSSYGAMDRKGKSEVISSFVIRPRRRIEMADTFIIEGDVVTTAGTCHPGVRFPREAWHGRRHFLKALPAADMVWTGNDEQVQGLLKLLNAQEIPRARGQHHLGYTELGAESLWVLPEMIIDADGIVRGRGREVHFIDDGAVLHRKMRHFTEVDPEETRRLAKCVLPRLLALNAPEVILPVIGWFFAAPLKPRIQRVLGHFPFLCVWGSPGSGKSTLLAEVFWPLMGVARTEPFSATETEFALLRLLSATNSIPVFIDEYKPGDMARSRRQTLHRYLRRLYTGEDESRGRADQSVVTYHLQAPLCLAGESRPIESALAERMLVANPSPNVLAQSPDCVAAMRALKAEDLGLLAPALIAHLLGRDTGADLARAQALLAALSGEKRLPLRVRDSLSVAICGLLHFVGFGQAMGVDLADLDFGALLRGQQEDLLERGGAGVKSGLDYFLETLSALAVSGAIQHNRQYSYAGGHLALHLGSCHAAYAEHARRVGFEGEVLDKKALLRQMQENHQRGGYVLELSRVVSFGSRYDKRRAALIDLEAVKGQLDVDAFPTEPGA